MIEKEELEDQFMEEKIAKELVNKHLKKILWS